MAFAFRSADPNTSALRLWARFSVISTSDAGQPYVLLSQVGSTALTVPVGGGHTLHSMLIVAGLAALWGAYVLRPFLSLPGSTRSRLWASYWPRWAGFRASFSWPG